MKTRVKVFLGFLIGLFTMGIVSTAYFSAFVAYRMKKLKESLKDYNY